MIALLALMILMIPGNAQDRFYVSPEGSVANPGTLAKPLGSLQAALSKVTMAKSKKVVIYLRGGRYHTTKTIALTPELVNNHELEITTYNHEAAVISGSTRLNPVWRSYTQTILQATLVPGLQLDRLFCNGKPLLMARYPNFDSTAAFLNSTAADAISAQRVKRWANPIGGYVHALDTALGDLHYRIKGRSRDSLLLEGGWQSNRTATMHKEHRFVENVFEELDAPGEWFYNPATGVLYLYPPDGLNIKTAVFERSVLDDIIRVTGSAENAVSNISISGVMFTGTNRTFMLPREPLLRSDLTIYRGGAIVTEGARNITISNCTFEWLGGNAVLVSRYNRNVAIEHNHMHDIGGTAIAFVGDPRAVRIPASGYAALVRIDKMDKTPGPKTNNYPALCRATDNLIQHLGSIERMVAGVQISMALDITISHNTIHDVPRAGIEVGDGCWGGHLFEYNDVYNTVLSGGDHGAYSSKGRDRFWLPGITDVDALVGKDPGLPLLDVIKPITIRNNRFHSKHGWAINLGDGSSNYRVYENLCLNGGLKLSTGFYRALQNNILLNSTFHPQVWYVNSRDVFANNIVAAEYAPLSMQACCRKVDSNFFIQPAALIAVQNFATDRNSLAGDPQFVDPGAFDYRVTPGSKALAVGFRNFTMHEFGVIDPILKAKAGRPRITGVKNP
ncbi:right-handed parallel beta-helix repeat-containing protein [Segetibacter sp. 3557_3]|nr:right-handed parallel beta-helix repeat-containing protein [Segetibacter sp. 3557_3]